MYTLRVSADETETFGSFTEAMRALVIRTITNPDEKYFQPYIVHPSRPVEFYLDHVRLMDEGYQNRHACLLLKNPERAFFAIKQIIYVNKEK